MSHPDDPRREPSDEDAARLLEAGLDPTSGSGVAPPPAPEEIAAYFPNFEILEVLGQGGMGVVYKARQKTLDRIVALKVLPESLSRDPAFAERFMREARMLARLQHPHIVLVYEFGESLGHHYLLMEYVDGVTLRQLMATNSITPKEALAIVPQICDALQYAHDQGVVHRDIKPENVLLDRAGKVKVADFGLAKLVQRGAADFTLTGTGQVMGTLHYMAPEQYKSPQDVDHRADIFSLGVVFYEMLTGELPVGRFANPSETTNLDTRIDEIVMRTLERERDLRFQQAHEVKAEVSTIGAAEPPRHRMGQRHAARRAARAGQHGGRRFSRWALAAAVSIPIAVLLGVAVFALVEQLSSGHGGWKRYYATIAGYWTALAGLASAVLIAVVGLVMTSRYKHRVRGHALSIVSLVVAFILIPVAISAGVEELQSIVRYRGLGDRELDLSPTPRIQVEGASSPRIAQEIREAIWETWTRYVTIMRDHDLDVADAKGLYAKGDWSQLRAMHPDELTQRREERSLGMGLVGRKQLSTPPWDLEITTIEVGPWARQAKVTARSNGVHLQVVIPMKPSEGRWVFELGKVRIETADYRPAILSDEDDG